MKQAILLFVTMQNLIAAGAFTQLNVCDTVSYSIKPNSVFYEVKKSQFYKYSAFILLDTCHFENKKVRMINQSGTYYYKSRILTQIEMLTVEKYLADSMQILNGGTVNISNKMKKFYRQYLAYTDINEKIQIEAIFCTRKFFKRNKYFKYNFLPPLITNREYSDLFSCKIEVSENFSKFALKSFERINRIKK